MNFMKDATVEQILSREDYWGQDISFLLDDVQKYYDIITKDGIETAYKTLEC